MYEELSRLEEVELREVWQHEAQDFTPWLAEDENLSHLAETLGLNLELEAQEIGVGDFQADILCKNEDDTWVVIENQLEETDHEHLGKLLTYSAGLDAHTVIWIAKNFRDEHRAALDQLNDITDDRVTYFGVEIKVWKIDASHPAPRFEIVCKPNDVPRSISTASINDWKTRFWSKFKDHLLSLNSRFNRLSPRPTNAVSFGIGHADFNLEARISKQKERIGTRLMIKGDDAIAYYHLLYSTRESIEEDVGKELEWEENPGKKACTVSLHKSDISPENEESWSDQHTWLAEKLELFDNVFRQRLQELDPSDYLPEDTDVE